MGRLRIVSALLTFLWVSPLAAQVCGTLATCPPASLPLNGSELMYIVQGGVSKKIQSGQLATILNALTVGTTPIVGGTPGDIEYNNSGFLGEKGVTGTGGVVLATAPTISSLTVGTAFTATGLVTNGDLANSSMTINGTSCTLGGSCTPAGSGLTVGTTPIASGTSGYVEYDNSGVLGELAVTGSGNAVLSTAPTISALTATGNTTLNTVVAGIWNGTTIGVANGGTGAVTFTANLPLIGAVTSALTQGTVSGNTTVFATSNGTLTPGDCVQIDSNGNYVDAGGACTTGGGGGTVSAGTAHDLAYYASSGTVVTGLASGNSGVLVTSGSGVPSISTTLPSGLSIGSPTITTAFTATGLVTNADLAHAATTVYGTTCTLGSTCSPAAADLTVGTSAIASGTNTYIEYNNSGTLGELAEVPVANGGTACTTASGTCLDNITGFSSDGILERTGSGTYAFLPYTATTWTPTLVGSSTAGSPSYSIQVGSYEKIGRQITVRFVVVTTGLGSPTGNMNVGGLPATSASTTNDDGSCLISNMSGVTLTSGYVNLTGVIFPGSSVIELIENGSGQSSTTISVSNFAAATQLVGWCSYHV